MRRKKAVEGIVVDLMDEEEVECDIDALLASSVVATTVEEEPKEVDTETPDYYMRIFNTLRAGGCSKCGKGIYGEKKRWGGELVCGHCHTVLRTHGLSAELKAYISAVYGAGCLFCEQKEGRFNLDHINMFTKEATIYSMIDKGYPEDIIREEISKCQLLCVPCHSIITRYEQKAGFHSSKKTLTRIKKKYGANSDKYQQEWSRLYAKYDAVMGPIYERVRALVARG